MTRKTVLQSAAYQKRRKLRTYINQSTEPITIEIVFIGRTTGRKHCYTASKSEAEYLKQLYKLSTQEKFDVKEKIIS